MHTDVAIVGAGIAGLAAAIALAESGLRVVVLERERTAGGRARSWPDPRTGDIVDIGPHILLSEYRNLFALLERFGTARRVTWNDDKFIQLVDGRQRTDVRFGRLPAPLHVLPVGWHIPLPWRAKRSFAPVGRLALQFDESQVARFDRIDALTLLQRCGVDPLAIRWCWRSIGMTILNAPLERCSAAALLRFMSFMLGVSGVRSGFAGCGLSELHADPAVALLQRLGGRVLSATDVQALQAAAGGIELVLQGGERLSAPRCIAAVPPQALSLLLPPQWLAWRSLAAAQAFEPSPYVCTYLWFDRRLTRERFWTRVWAPDTLNYDFYELCGIRSGWDGRDGSVIAANAMYSHRAACLDDAEVVAATLAELADAIPGVGPSMLRHARVHRIEMGIPCPLPGSEQKRPPTRTPVNGLYLAGDWTATGLPASMESAARSGWLAAEAVLEDIGRPRLLARAPPRRSRLAALAGGRPPALPALDAAAYGSPGPTGT